jgi:hypothetical protein
MWANGQGGPALVQAVNDRVRRLQEEARAAKPGVDTQWITPALYMKYDAWVQANGGVDKQGRQLSFFEWAGSSTETGGNKEPPPPPPPKVTPGQRARDVNTNPANYLDDPAYQDPASQAWLKDLISRNSSPRGRVTYGGPNPITTTPPGGPGGQGGGTPPGYEPSGGQYLDALKQSLQQSQSEAMDASLRAFNHQAGLGGLEDTGAFGTMSGDLVRGITGDNNKALNEAMMGASEGEQERLLKWAIANIKKKVPDYGDLQIGSGDDWRQQQLDQDQYQFDQQLGLDYWNMILDWFDTFGSMPGPGGPQMPTVPVAH